MEEDDGGVSGGSLNSVDLHEEYHGAPQGEHPTGGDSFEAEDPDDAALAQPAPALGGASEPVSPVREYGENFGEFDAFEATSSTTPVETNQSNSRPAPLFGDNPYGTYDAKNDADEELLHEERELLQAFREARRMYNRPEESAPSAVALSTELRWLQIENERLNEEKKSLEAMLAKFMALHGKVKKSVVGSKTIARSFHA